LDGVTPDQLPQNRGVGPAQKEVEVEVEEEVEREEEVRAAHAHEPRGVLLSEAPQPTSLDPDTRTLLGALNVAIGAERSASARRFLNRRSMPTWAAWIREMLKLIGPGSQFTAEDLACVLDDDAALEQPIKGPFALRTFLGKSRSERLNRASGDAPSANGANGATERPDWQLSDRERFDRAAAKIDAEDKAAQAERERLSRTGSTRTAGVANG
jgi:hypothetical protein